MTPWKWIKRMLCMWCGKCPRSDHRVEWRRQNTIDGIKWKRIHHPLENPKL